MANAVGKTVGHFSSSDGVLQTTASLEGFGAGQCRFATADETAAYAAWADHVHCDELKDGDVLFVVVADFDGGPADCIVGVARKPSGEEYACMAHASPVDGHWAAWSHCADDLVLVLGHLDA